MSEARSKGRVVRGTPWLIAKAEKNPEFRRELIDNPTEVVQRELGITLDDDVVIEVLEDSPTTRHVVLPLKPELPARMPVGGAVSDAELLGLLRGAAAREHVCTYSFCPNESDNI